MAGSTSFFSVLLLLVTVSHAASPAEEYWNSVLPNTPMPTAISERITPDMSAEAKEDKSVTIQNEGFSVGVSKGAVNVDVGVNPGKGNTGAVNTSPSKGHGRQSNAGVGVGVGKGGVNVGVGVNPGKGNTRPGKRGSAGVGVGVGKGGGVNVGVGVRPPWRGRPGSHVHPGDFQYRYAASQTQLHDDPDVARFFLQNDLHAGKKMTLHFTRTTPDTPFIPKHVADNIPFSSSNLPEILGRLAIKPESDEAVVVKNTLTECESPAVKGERKTCATSLEAMVEFATSSLGTHDVQAVSTAAAGDGRKQQHTIVGIRKMSGQELVACHAEEYAYAVFYCHWTGSTEAYNVRLVGEDGAVIDAVAVCHKDTRAWNPKHISFQMLNVKPGKVPVCHFLPQDHLVWSRRG